MPSYLTPGVYVEEVPSASKPIEGVGTSVAAFVGLAPGGPLNTPVQISNWTQFARTFGDPTRDDGSPYLAPYRIVERAGVKADPKRYEYAQAALAAYRANPNVPPLLAESTPAPAPIRVRSAGPVVPRTPPRLEAAPCARSTRRPPDCRQARGKRPRPRRHAPARHLIDSHRRHEA